MLSPSQLRLLALIQRHGSLAGAATALGLTAAAVTQQVTRAESDCRVTLVHRGPRGALLTAAGAVLAAHGQIIDQETARAATGLDTLLGRLALRLRLGAFQAAALHLLPPALTALRHRHPDADLSVIDLTSEHGIAAVAAGDVDVAVIAVWHGRPVAPDHVVVHPLLSDPMVVVLPDDHSLSAGAPAPVRLGELRDAAWVSIRAGHAARAQFDQAATTAGFTARVRFETESYDVAQALVGTGVGVALVSRLALTHLPGTVHRELTAPGLHRRLYAVTPADVTSIPLADVYLNLLRDVADEITATGAQQP